MAITRPVYSACIDQTNLFGLTGDESRLTDAELESDMEQIGDTSLMRLGYSRAAKVTVCSNDHYIHGLQISLQMHASEDDEFDNSSYDD